MDLRKIVGHRTLLMPCAGAIIGDGKGNVLLQLRKDDNTWATHGGSVELDERVSKGWMVTNAFFKAEQVIINIVLGYGRALDIFNKGIVMFGLL